MRFTLLASAGVVAMTAAFALFTPANAADCGCKDAVRAALAKQAPVVQRAPMPAAKPAPKPAARMARRAPARTCNCGVATHAAPNVTASASESFYDYRAAGAVDNYPYTHHWTVAPQGYVPPLAAAAYGVPAYDGPADLPPYGPMPQGAAYGEDYADAGGYAQGGSYAYAQAPAITVEQQGWFGGVGYGREGGGGGGGGGGGMTLTLSQPDSYNGPSYNSFGQSYGGDYQSAAKVNAFRTQAFTPPASSSK